MWKNKEKEKQNSLYLIYKKKSVTKLNLYCDSIFIRFEIKKIHAIAICKIQLHFKIINYKKILKIYHTLVLEFNITWQMGRPL